jgi:DNA-binding LacI/PurR family transcriptional regulator
MHTIHDVAREAGVSLATVSRAFRSPHLLNKETQERVRSVADRLGYTIRQAKRQSEKPLRESRLRTANSVAIGFLFVPLTEAESLGTNFFYAPVLMGAQSAAAQLGIPLMVQTVAPEKVREQILLMSEQQAVRGVLVVGSVGGNVLGTLTDLAPQIVLVDNATLSTSFESVVSHGFQGGYLATQHLLQLGHQRIACITASGVNTFQERLRGFISALWEAGLPPARQDILSHTFSDVMSIAEIHAYLDRAYLNEQTRPTAFFAVNDHHALLAMQVCKERGIRVPEDMSIIGFDNILEGQYVTPALTTMEVDKEKMGNLAVSLLHSHCTKNTKNTKTSGEGALMHYLRVSLVVRQSCQPPSVLL